MPLATVQWSCWHTHSRRHLGYNQEISELKRKEDQWGANMLHERFLQVMAIKRYGEGVGSERSGRVWFKQLKMCVKPHGLHLYVHVSRIKIIASSWRDLTLPCLSYAYMLLMLAINSSSHLFNKTAKRRKILWVVVVGVCWVSNTTERNVLIWGKMSR